MKWWLISVARIAIGILVLCAMSPQPSEDDLYETIMRLTPVPDKQGRPIKRDPIVIRFIAKVCAETSVPLLCALNLDVLAARESGYGRQDAGDCPGLPAGSPKCTRELGAQHCGIFQTACAKTPKDQGLAQTRIAWADFKRSIDACPDHPLMQYASGACKYSKTASDYEYIVRLHAAEVP